jgi:hypothetical protein
VREGVDGEGVEALEAAVAESGADAQLAKKQPLGT